MCHVQVEFLYDILVRQEPFLDLDFWTPFIQDLMESKYVFEWFFLFLFRFLLLYLKSSFFYPQLTFRYLIQPDLEFRFIVRSHLGPVFSQAPLLVLDYRWSHNPPTHQRTVTPNRYRTNIVPKFGFQSSRRTVAYHYILCKTIRRPEFYY